MIGEIQSKNPKLDYGVAPIPAWKAGMPRMMLLQPEGVYVNGQSQNKAAAWDFVKFLTNAQNGLRLTEMTGWLSPRTDIDWKPLLAKTPQFEAFVVAAGRHQVLCRAGADRVRRGRDRSSRIG